MLFDRENGNIKILAHSDGGTDVEDNPLDSYWMYASVDATTDFDDAGQSLADYYKLPDQTFRTAGLLQNLYSCFC